MEGELKGLQQEQREMKQQLDTAQRNRDDEARVEVKTAQQALVKAIQVLEQVYGPASFVQQAQQAQSRGEGGKAIVAMLAQIGEDLVKQEDTMRTNEQKAKEAFVKF